MGKVIDDLLERVVLRKFIDLEIIDKIISNCISNPLVFDKILLLKWRTGHWNVAVSFQIN
jgi:hypothetical protein